jgi:hypothetical protein
MLIGGRIDFYVCACSVVFYEARLLGKEGNIKNYRSSYQTTIS